MSFGTKHVYESSSSDEGTHSTYSVRTDPYLCRKRWVGRGFLKNDGTLRMMRLRKKRSSQSDCSIFVTEHWE